MTRIISGAAKGRTLRVPEKVTRPTSDRIREAVFSSLEHRLGSWHGRCVYDLFAGSGAFALEAMSRGAGHAVAVERDRRAAEVIRANAASTGLALDVVVLDVAQFVARVPSPPPDVVFVDPPYELSADLLASMLGRLLEQLPGREVLLVVERSARDQASPLPPGLQDIDRRTIGDTTITYARWYG